MRRPGATRRSSRKRRWRLGAAGITLAGASYAAHVLGWTTPARRWQEASGWDRLPEELRPANGPLWPPDGGGEPPDIRWLGHSGFVVRWGDRTFLLDPNTSSWCTVTRRVLEPAVDVASIGAVDAALISHTHYDHLDVATLSAAAPATIVVPRGSEVYFAEGDWPHGSRQPLSLWESADFGEVEITAVPAAHNGSRTHPLRSRKLAVGYVLRRGEDAIYYAGDTGFGDHFAAIAQRFAPRLALLPIGAFSPRFPMRYYHLSPAEAVEAARVLGVETVVPAHFGTFRLALDDPAEALPRFARAASLAGVRWQMPRLWKADGSVGPSEGAGRLAWRRSGDA